MCEIPSTGSSTWWDFLFVTRQAERPAYKVVVNLSFNHPKKEKNKNKNKNKVYHWEHIKKKNLEITEK